MGKTNSYSCSEDKLRAEVDERMSRSDESRVFFNFSRYMGITKWISVFFFVLSVGVVITQGQKSLGIDFLGGFLQQVRFNKEVTVEELRSYTVREISDIQIQEVTSSPNEFILKVPFQDRKILPEVLTRFIQSKLGTVEVVRAELIGPSIGRELTEKGVLALIFSLICILIYLSFRFEFVFSVGAVVALFHDIVICVGLYIFLGQQLSLQSIAALLTIVGYSLNDTIVLYDRIREMMDQMHGREKFISTVNMAICATFSRTLLTSLTTLIVVVLLYIFGGELISPFALLLVLGVIVGTYSSIFVASNVVISYKARQLRNHSN